MLREKGIFLVRCSIRKRRLSKVVQWACMYCVGVFLCCIQHKVDKAIAFCIVRNVVRGFDFREWDGNERGFRPAERFCGWF